jgi:hypothetical protein
MSSPHYCFEPVILNMYGKYQENVAPAAKRTSQVLLRKNEISLVDENTLLNYGGVFPFQSNLEYSTVKMNLHCK